ncbi:hypothetical protein CAPTEDRAFT_193092 [Capitella teleta]|uniref:Uncharacterized protein n=1 Tax=Capitella teleta TaxID=283909 RepID=R7TQI9_CAPTE|nr:hypothetical protein CAPTEDRAFT_193092 [Capitella teleta]|eukprot:ELT93771.1 hypothetical protein CAPTEDRAFT_193092 [Capitella teleta]
MYASMLHRSTRKRQLFQIPDQSCAISNKEQSLLLPNTSKSTPQNKPKFEMPNKNRIVINAYKKSQGYKNVTEKTASIIQPLDYNPRRSKPKIMKTSRNIKLYDDNF